MVYSNYGKENKVDFTKLEGIVGIFGKNFSGKSSIIDSMLYTIYNTTPKSSKIANIVNEHSSECQARVVIKIADKDYIIERGAVHNEKSITDMTLVLSLTATMVERFCV